MRKQYFNSHSFNIVKEFDVYCSDFSFIGNVLHYRLLRARPRKREKFLEIKLLFEIDSFCL